MSANQNIADALSGITGAVLPALSGNAKPRTRVWKACEICRKRKIKCDGQQPCGFCKTNAKDCTFTEIADHASGQRQITSHFENRLIQLEQIVTPMAKVFEEWAKANIPSMIPSQPEAGPSSSTAIADGTAIPNAFSPIRTARSPYRPSVSIQSMLNPYPSDSLPLPPFDEPRDEDEPPISDRFSHLTKDSLGNLRFIGGAPSLVLVEALQSLQSSQTPDASPDSVPSESAISKGTANLELPFFRPNVHFRRFDVLPQPEDTVFPPSDVADHLVETYFQTIHHTFPILNKKIFLKRYTEVMQGVHSGKPSGDHAFLSSLFAVFACAQSLSTGKSTSSSADTSWKWTGPAEYAGLEFYERSMVLFWMGSRLMSIENVQCLALLAICCAGWNTLSQSWILAGQAIRAAQDLGLHRSPRRLSLSSVEKEQRRRIWWCVYGLDRVLSISLGRPGATNDDDSDVEFPTEVDDEDLEAYFSGKLSLSDSSYMCGFVALLKIYIVAGKIVRSAHSLQLHSEINDKVTVADGPAQVPVIIHQLDVMLEEWVDSLPSNVKYAANNAGNPKMLTLCLISFFMYYGGVLNLYRPFIPYPREVLASGETSVAKCVSAARACIRIGDMVRHTLPTSHHLAYAVQHICLSGVILLRIVTSVNEHALVTAILADAEKCTIILEGLEEVWPGARRCKEIVSELLIVVKARWEHVKDAFAAQVRAPAPSQGTQLGKRKAVDEFPSSSLKQARARVDGPAADMEAEAHGSSYFEGPDIAGDAGNGVLTDFGFDLSVIDPGGLQQQFSGYDFLGTDLEIILDHVMGENTGGGNIYDPQMLWNVWEGEGTL